MPHNAETTLFPKKTPRWVWWWTPEILALWRQRQDGWSQPGPHSEFQATQCSITKPVSKLSKEKHNAILLKTPENVQQFSSHSFFQNHLSSQRHPCQWFFVFKLFFPEFLSMYTIVHIHAQVQSLCKVHLGYFSIPAHWSFKGALVFASLTYSECIQPSTLSNFSLFPSFYRENISSKNRHFMNTHVSL